MYNKIQRVKKALIHLVDCIEKDLVKLHRLIDVFDKALAISEQSVNEAVNYLLENLSSDDFTMFYLNDVVIDEIDSLWN